MTLKLSEGKLHVFVVLDLRPTLVCVPGFHVVLTLKLSEGKLHVFVVLDLGPTLVCVPGFHVVGVEIAFAPPQSCYARYKVEIL